MVKAYLRYEPKATIGLISSTQSNVIYDHDGKLAIAPALEDAIVWDLKKGIQVAKWHESTNKAEVTCIARSPNKTDYAVGYNDGSIRLWNIKSATSSVTFNGHRSAVTALAFDNNGTRLASGSRDTDLIVWDIVGEVGLYRLRGHKDQITCLYFLSHPNSTSSSDEHVDSAATLTSSTSNYILSSSKDSLLKLWDLTTQHCIETLVAHRGEIWSFDVSNDRSIIVTGGSDAELKVWRIDWTALDVGLDEDGMDTSEDGMNETGKETGELKKSISLYGPIPRQSKERVVTLQFHSSGKFLGCQATDKSVELYRIQTQDEIRKKMARRRKRQKEKAEKKAKAVIAGDTADMEMNVETGETEIKAEDEITQYQIIRTVAKVRSFDFAPVADIDKAGGIQVLISTNNNVLEVYSAALPPKKKADELPEPTKLYSVDLHGHRSDVRTLALSSDDELLCSASNNMLKIWNIQTTSCIRSIECGYALCSSFLPGNRHIILGTKGGELELYDIASSSLLETIKAHEGPVWSLQVRPDKRGLVTGSADKDVKFWDFDMIEQAGSGQNRPKRLTLVHMRTLKMSDDVLCVRYSPDQNLIVVSLLDATVKVFYHDTLKFFLSLYGHKLPVLSMDISSDNTLLVTCSADKNVKLWGLDFGDCHKSIFAHQESIMSVQFVWGTHYFFTAGKDRVVKYWDGDKFENIMKLDGHHGEVWALAIAKHGSFVVSGSHDRSIRVWERTEEQLFLEEEREKELEELYETTLSNQLEKTDLQDGESPELASAGKQTMETLKAGERIIEALDVGDEDKGAWEEYELLKSRGFNAVPPQGSPILIALGGITPDKYVLNTVEKIRANDLEEALLVLPFSKVISLIGYLDVWAKKNWNILLTCRILFSLLKTHHNQIVSNRMMRPLLDSIRFHLREQLKRQKNTMGYNIAALRYIRRDWENRNIAEFWDEDDQKEKDGTKKRKFVTVTV